MIIIYSDYSAHCRARLNEILDRLERVSDALVLEEQDMGSMSSDADSDVGKIRLEKLLWRMESCDDAAL